MDRRLATNVSGAIPAGRRSRSPGSALAAGAQVRRSVRMTREVLQLDASVDCDEAAAREAQYLRQHAEHLESRLEQGRRGVLALETEVSSLLTQGPRAELEARIRDEQAMEMAHNQPMSQVSAMLRNATSEMEESDFQRRTTMNGSPRLSGTTG